MAATSIWIGWLGPIQFASTGSGVSLVGPLLLGDGTASAPAYSFTSHTNYGMFLDGATRLGLSLAGTENFFFNTSAAFFIGNNAGTLVLGGSNDTTLERFAAGAFGIPLASLATTSTSALVLRNSTAATGGATVQMSPRLLWRGNAWDTAASETVDFFAENLPATAATPTGTWKLGYSLNGAAATYPLTVSSAGAVTPLGQINTAAGTTAIAPIVITSGTNLTAATANAIENDGTAFYKTGNTTNGRTYWDGWNYFRLTGSGSGITTIADFFGTNDGIPLVANGFYEIEWFCYFSQATAGTATWTIVTATTALATLTGEYEGSNIAGIGTVGANQTAAINATTSSSTAFPVTGTEATGTTHYFKIRAMLQAGNGASNTRLRLTMGAGTATPLVNSYFRVRQLSGGNVGAFVA